MEKKQLYNLIEETLKQADLYSLHACNLVYGTICQESIKGKYIRQLKGGPALGIAQIEPATHNDIWNNYLKYKGDLVLIIYQVCNITNINPESLVYNLKYSILMCRIHYLRYPEPIPTDLTGYAKLWKKRYNTEKGSGTIKEFIENYDPI